VDGPSPTYSIVGGDDGDKFVINPTTGVLSFIAPPDYESPTDSDSDNGYEVVVEVSDGTATDTQAITVTVTDVAEGAPPAATNDAWTLSDETAIAPGVITAAWFTHNDSDPDGDTLYVTDVSGLPSGLTANFDGSGHLIDITGTTPAAGSYNISYTLSDGSNSTTATVAITVVNTTSSGTDTIVLNGNDFSYVDLLSGADTVTGDLVLTGNAGIDTFVGGAGSDTLNGGAGNDALTGDAGDDKLNGGIGNDVLTGGNNADQFIFNSALNAATNVDTIMDFNAADGAASNQDSIVLEDAIFAGFGPTLDAGEFAANAGGNATGASAQILYDTATGNLYYDSDGTGGANKILFATISLAGVSDTVDHSDFLIV
jgi:Ca2+-binding RTX toxin-like protein